MRLTPEKQAHLAQLIATRIVAADKEGLVDDAWLQKKPKLQIYSGLPISFSMVWRHR